MTPSEREKMLNEVGLNRLKKFVGRKDYKNARLERKGKRARNPQRQYRISAWRKRYVYLLWTAIGPYPPSGLVGHKMTVKELKEDYEVVQEAKP